MADASGTKYQESLLNELENGSIRPDEFFCMLVSYLGNEETEKSFLSLISRVKQSEKLFHELTQMYDNYFLGIHSYPLSIDTPVNKLEDDLDFQLAVKLSLEEQAGGLLGGSDIYETVSKEEKVALFKYTGTGTVRTEARMRSNYIDYEDKSLSNPHSLNVVDNGKTMTNGWASVVSSNLGNPKLPLAPVPKVNQNLKFNSNINHNKPDDVKAKSEQVAQGNNFTDSHVSKTKKKKRKGSSCGCIIYLLRRDLRIYDNPALTDASESNVPVIPVFLWSENQEGHLAAGGATKVWLHYALLSLNKSYEEQFKSKIIFRKTDSYENELLDIVKSTGAKTVIWDDQYEPVLKHRDDKIEETLKLNHINVKRFHSYLLHEPGSVSTDEVGLRGIGSVSHFMTCCNRSNPSKTGIPLDPPTSLTPPSAWPWSHSLEQLELDRMPRRKDGSIIDWAAEMRRSWDFSENAAYDALQIFLSDGVRRYEKESGRADCRNTCHISPYLHFGQISPRTIIAEAKFSKSPKFLRKLAWRDLSYWLLTLFPDMATEPLRPPYKHQRWSSNKQHLKAWQKGNTGYPLVDAAMRELWKTGWMNNYMRHVVASFLISYLHLTWVEGYNWFQDTLLDADVAINSMMWQNGGMSGLDHWNFVMHPVDAAMTCDPKGDYVRRWVPELSGLPDEFIHRPWKCPPSVLRRNNISFGDTYPIRIITDLDGSREQSLKDVIAVRKRFPKWVHPTNGHDLVPIPNGRVISVITRREFMYKTQNPDTEDNPHNAVLKGYRTRERDESIAFAEKNDFLASTMKECVTRRESRDKRSRYEVIG